VPDRQELILLEGEEPRSRRGGGLHFHKRSRGELVTQVDELSSGDEVQEVGAPRGKS
jgi:hypothetical protein